MVLAAGETEINLGLQTMRPKPDGLNLSLTVVRTGEHDTSDIVGEYVLE